MRMARASGCVRPIGLDRPRHWCRDAAGRARRDGPPQRRSGLSCSGGACRRQIALCWRRPATRSRWPGFSSGMSPRSCSRTQVRAIGTRVRRRQDRRQDPRRPARRGPGSSGVDRRRARADVAPARSAATRSSGAPSGSRRYSENGTLRRPARPAMVRLPRRLATWSSPSSTTSAARRNGCVP